MPCALTEIEPPTEKMSVDCIACTAKRGWSWRWMSCQVAPLCTVTTRRSASSWMRLKGRMSSSTAPGAKAWPPMLWRTPATETFNPASRAYASAARTSSSLRTATTPCTGVRLRQLASFTVPPRCVHGSREASTTGAAVAAAGSASGPQSFSPTGSAASCDARRNRERRHQRHERRHAEPPARVRRRDDARCGVSSVIVTAVPGSVSASAS